MYVWTEIKRLECEGDYEHYRWRVMCCSVSYQTEKQWNCTICGGDHLQVLRRIRCTSETCSTEKKCPVIWKALHCTSRDTWVVFVNDKPHLRNTTECAVKHTPHVTKEIKTYVAQEDELRRVTPRILKTRIMKNTNIKTPPHGDVSEEQIANVLKRAREDGGRRNTVESIKEFIATHVYTPRFKLALKEGFLFGPMLDLNGMPKVASGHDHDPFTVGVTSMQLIDDSLRFASAGRFAMFHADATFKLSDYAYPVITCGFTDSARSYQLTALFVVSQRTRRDFRLCFSALSELVRRVRGQAFHVSALMGDADRAQLRGLQDTYDFAGATPLMCYFHVLYNVRKKIAHLPVKIRIVVMLSIVDMHLCSSLEEFIRVRDEQLRIWQRTPELTVFRAYFLAEWLESEFWRWQIFHSPPGYATTNNPSEVYHAGMKSYTQHERFHMTKLLTVLTELVESHKSVTPVARDFLPAPSSDVIKAAKHMVASGRLRIEHTVGESCVRVFYQRSAREQDPTEDEEEFAAVFDRDLELDKKTAASSNEGLKREAEKKKAAKLYERVNSWYLWRAHMIGMPPSGWLVHYKDPNCCCKYFHKFKVCAHLVIAQNRQDLSALGLNPKILDRSRKRTKTKKAGPADDTPSAQVSQSDGRAQTLEATPTGAPEGEIPAASRIVDQGPEVRSVEERWPWRQLSRAPSPAYSSTSRPAPTPRYVDGSTPAPLHSQLPSVLIRANSVPDGHFQHPQAQPMEQQQPPPGTEYQDPQPQSNYLPFSPPLAPGADFQPLPHRPFHIQQTFHFQQPRVQQQQLTPHGYAHQQLQNQPHLDFSWNQQYPQHLGFAWEQQPRQYPELSWEQQHHEDIAVSFEHQQYQVQPRPVDSQQNYPPDLQQQLVQAPLSTNEHVPHHAPNVIRLEDFPRRKRGRQALSARALDVEDVMN